MKKLYALNEWGIHISQADIASGLITAEQIAKAGGMLINPIAGEIYFCFNDCGDRILNCVVAEEPFWLVPVLQPGLFRAPYDDVRDIEYELDGVFPAELLEKQTIRERLCRANVVDEQEDGHG